MTERPAVGDRVVVSNCGKRDPFSGTLVKVTRRRVDRTCERPVTYWHIRLDSGKVERWVNVHIERAGSDVAGTDGNDGRE